MFGQSAGQIQRDINMIVGRTLITDDDTVIRNLLPPLSLTEQNTLSSLLGIFKTGVQLSPDLLAQLKALIQRFVHNGGADPGIVIPDVPNTPPKSGCIIDFSSPLNTIVKSLFLLSLSPMFSGTSNFYFLSVGCSSAIIYSLLKLNNR